MCSISGFHAVDEHGRADAALGFFQDDCIGKFGRERKPKGGGECALKQVAILAAEAAEQTCVRKLLLAQFASLAVYVQTNAAAPVKFKDLELVTGDNESGLGFSSRVEWDAEKDTSYLIALDGAFAGGGQPGQGIACLRWKLFMFAASNPTIRKQPADQQINVVNGQVRSTNLSFSVAIMNKRNWEHSYAWYRDGNPIPVFTETTNSNRSTFKNPSATTNDVGSYFVEIQRAGKKTVSRMATLSLVYRPDDFRNKGVGNAGTLVTPISGAVNGSFSTNNVVFDRYLRFPSAFGTGSGVTNQPEAGVSNVSFWTINCQNAGVDTYILTARTAHPYSKGADSDNVPFICNGVNQKLSGTNHLLGQYNYNFTIYYRKATLPAGRTNIVWSFQYQ